MVCFYKELDRIWKKLWRACSSGCVSKSNSWIVSAATIQVFSAAFLYYVWSDLPTTVWWICSMQWGLRWYQKGYQSMASQPGFKIKTCVSSSVHDPLWLYAFSAMLGILLYLLAEKLTFLPSLVSERRQTFKKLFLLNLRWFMRKMTMPFR